MFIPVAHVINVTDGACLTPVPIVSSLLMQLFPVVSALSYGLMAPAWPA